MTPQPTKSDVAAAEEIDAMLGIAVNKNTGLMTGFFSGVSIMDSAKVIARHAQAEHEAAEELAKAIKLLIEDAADAHSGVCTIMNARTALANWERIKS